MNDTRDESAPAGDEVVKLLLVDDRAENLFVLSAVLSDPGYECVTASSGHAALSILLRDQAFAAILLDVQMPDLDGFELARLIRGNRKTRDIPIIFISAAYTSVDDALKGFSLAAVDYLMKPYDDQILRAKVRVLAERYRAALRARRSEVSQLRAIGRSDAGAPGTDWDPTIRAGETWREMIAWYREILSMAVEESAYKIERRHVLPLQELARRLGSGGLGPNDVIELHLAALGGLEKASKPFSNAAYVAEGRMLLLELLGEVLLYYRNLNVSPE